MVIKAVIFDLDGTLLVHKLKLHEAKKEFLNRLRERLHGSIESSIDFPIAYILNELSEEDRITAFKILNEVFEPFEMMAAEVAELREDVKETLEFLKSRDVKLAIATNNS
ncbi:MAG: HAD hydrolase-like protein, partial [Thaumarchaeota archaeon]|nr:HAD hydrolase-like protein [Candidatus Geocrenenecus arthurdayi]